MRRSRSENDETLIPFDETRTTLFLTFTLNCHLGKTHDHRSRGDTPWKAQTTIPVLYQ